MVNPSREDEIATKVEGKFIDHYPNICKNFKEHIKPFVSWVVKEVIKEVNNGK